MRVIDQKGSRISPMAADSDPPEGFNWDMWNGPAPEHKYNETLRRQWRFFWRHCGGDLTYDGIHQVDLARWLCGLEYPKTVFSNSAPIATARPTPDTQLAVLEFDDLMMSFDVSLNTPYMIKADEWRAKRRHLSLLAAEHRADRNLRQRRPDVRRPGWARGGGSTCGKEPPADRSQMHGRFPDKEHQQNFIGACGAATGPTPTSGRATSLCSWCTTR